MSTGLIIGNLNINSIPNKFDQLKFLIKDKVDILLITETKLDSTFPETQYRSEKIEIGTEEACSYISGRIFLQRNYINIHFLKT